MLPRPCGSGYQFRRCAEPGIDRFRERLRGRAACDHVGRTSEGDAGACLPSGPLAAAIRRAVVGLISLWLIVAGLLTVSDLWHAIGDGPVAALISLATLFTLVMLAPAMGLAPVGRRPSAWLQRGTRLTAACAAAVVRSHLVGSLRRGNVAGFLRWRL